MVNMTSESPNQTTNYMDGREEEYTDCVHVLTEKEAIWPGCTKIKDISVRPILVKIIDSYFMVYLDSGSM